jgi:hypothetical protein
MERGAYALGVGLVEMRADMLSGSSGGFLEGQTLVAARVNGRVLALRGPQIRLGVESDEPSEMAFEDSAGRRLFEAQLPAGVRYQSIPLYSKPNVAFPPGGYRLAVRTPGGAMSSLPVAIE